MEDSRKKPIMICIILACLVLAVVISVKTKTKETGIPEEFEGEKVLVKCTDPNCESEYEVDKYYYYKYISENRKGMPDLMLAYEKGVLRTGPPLVCEKCGKDTVYKAFKCTNPDCGIVFEAGSSGVSEREDSCPICKHSESEEQAKRFRDEANANSSK